MSTTPAITIGKCNLDTVRGALTDLGLETKGSGKIIVGRLSTYYGENEKTLNIASCDVCNGDSDASLPECPFCGTGGEVEPGPEPEAPAAEAKPNGKAPKKKKAKKKKAAPTVVEDAPADEPAADGASIVSVKDLDTKVEVIRQCQSDGAIALHRLGAAAKAISDEGLWKLRATKDGVSRFRNFKQFCVEELGMTGQHIYRAIKVSEEFTVDEIAGLSGQQVRVVLQLPAEARQDGLTAAQNGESTGELSDRAAALQGKDGDAPPPAKAVTVAVSMGMQKVDVFKRPSKGAKVADIENAEPAVSLDDHPWFAVDLKNKVRLIVRLTKKKNGQMAATVEFRRGEQVV